MEIYYVYIMASKKNGTLYVGVTDDLIRRVYEHKNDLVEGFTKRYQIHTLVYFEESNDVLSAIAREKQLKKWKRRWKIELIEKTIQLGMTYMMDWFKIYLDAASRCGMIKRVNCKL